MISVVETNISRLAILQQISWDDVGIVRYESDDERFPGRYRSLSPTQLERLDNSVRELLAEAGTRASQFLKDNQSLVETLRDLLLEKKVIDAKTLGEITGRDPSGEETSEK